MLRVSVKLVGVAPAVVGADKLEAREPTHAWAAVQKRGAMTFQKKTCGLA